jgi:ubiquinone/menaquinone biosynthesis C-methylase UbiE
MPEEIYRTPIQEIQLERNLDEGVILDIGGGSEALVSRIYGERVCAVDLSLMKIREGQIYGTGANWFLADAGNLCFQSCSFSIATLWFSLAYIKDDRSKRVVLKEVHRVLQEGGIMSVLGPVIPGNMPVFEFNAVFMLPDAYPSRIRYRVQGDQKQSLQIVEEYAKEAGLETEYSVNHEYWFKLVCRK